MNSERLEHIRKIQSQFLESEDKYYIKRLVGERETNFD